MHKKRIAILSFHTCPLASEEGKETGGMNVYVLELAKQLVKKGCIVDIFTRSQDTHLKKLVLVTSNLRVIHIKAGPEKTIAKKKLSIYIPEFAANITSFLQKEKIIYDIFDCHYYLSGLAGLLLQKTFPNTPITITFHTLALMKNLVARDQKEKEKKERIEAEFQLVEKAQHIITPSHNDRAYLQYLYDTPQEKITVITPGVNTHLFKPINKLVAKQKIKAEKNHKIILFVGRIEPLKGIDVLMYAIKILLAKNPTLPLCLWIVGGDVSQKRNLWSKELQKLESLQRLLKLTAQVHFVGQQPQHNLPYYYNASELVVMPSHYESFGITALEAMACGIPVITSNVAGISSIIDDMNDSLITSANNPLLLASQIENLLSNEKEHTSISKKISKQVKHITWEKTANDIISLYEKLIDRELGIRN